MIPNGNILVDISGNGKNGTISNCVSLKDGIKFISNKQSKITFAGAQVAYPSSISLRFKPGVINVSDRSIIGQGIGYPYIIFTNGILKCGWYSGSWYSKVSSSIALAQDKIYTITYTCAANEGKIYVNGVDVSTTGENVNVPTPVIFMADIGNNWYTDGTVYDVRFHNKILSLQEIRNYHNSFVQPTLVETFDEGADGVAKVPSGWNKNSGSFKIGEIITRDTILKHLEKGTKYLECITAGTISLPSKQAYGTWEFDWYKGGDSNVTVVYPINNNLLGFYASKNAYRLSSNASEALWLVRENGASETVGFGSNDAYISNNTWYRIKITRSTSGVFTVLIKGGSFTPIIGYDGWTLVSPKGAYTNPVIDNTYTTSEYFVLDIDAGDRIANIQLTNGIKQ